MLHYSVASRKMNFGKDKGKTKYYAQRDVRSTLTLRQVEDQIVQKTSLARGDVRNAIASLAEVVNDALLSGLKVDLGDLGSFGVEANGRMMATEEEVTAKSIKKPQIRYNPKHTMRKYAQEVAINVHRPNDANPRAVGAVGLCYAIGWRASRLEGCGGATSPHIRANKGESFFLCASLIIPFRGFTKSPKGIIRKERRSPFNSQGNDYVGLTQPHTPRGSETPFCSAMQRKPWGGSWADARRDPIL